MKKRVMLTLTEENYKRAQALFKEAGLPSVTLSVAVDDFLRDLSEIMEKAKARGSFTLKDIFEALAQQFSNIQEEEKRDDKEFKKTIKEGTGYKCPDCGEPIRAFDWCPHCQK